MTIPNWKAGETSYRQLGGIPLIQFPSFQSLEAHLKLYISYKWVRAQIQAPYPNLWGLEITMVLPIKVTPTAPSDVHLPDVTGFPDAPHNSYGRPCVPPTPLRANPAPPQERYTVTLYLVQCTMLYLVLSCSTLYHIRLCSLSPKDVQKSNFR